MALTSATIATTEATSAVTVTSCALRLLPAACSAAHAPKDAPPDLDESQAGVAAMPEALRRELQGLGLL